MREMTKWLLICFIKSKYVFQESGEDQKASKKGGNYGL